MTFTVTYRAADGAVREERMEAAGRGECFAQYRARGITPISVKEGDFVSRRERGSSRDGKNGSRAGRAELERGKRIPYVFLIAFIVLIGGGLWCWRWGGGRGTTALPEKMQERNLPKATLPKEMAPAKKPGPAAAPAVTNNAAAVSEAAKKPKERHDTISIHTNNLGKVVEKWIGADGKKHMSVRYARKPVFDNASDDQLAMAVGGGGTQAIAPIPMAATSEQEFLESLKKPIVIDDDDPERVKRIKEAVIAARETMKQMMDEGKSYREALAEHQKLVNENVETRNQCMAELKQLVDAGDREGAEHYLKTMNVALEQMGIPALTMPMSREELNAARQRRKKELEAAKRSGK